MHATCTPASCSLRARMPTRPQSQPHARTQALTHNTHARMYGLMHTQKHGTHTHGMHSAHACMHTGSSAAPYQKITSGTCASKGMKPITEQSECNAAAPFITSAETKSEVTTRANRPEGCYELHGRFWLATNKANVGNGASGSRHPICKQQGANTHTHTHARAHCLDWPGSLP